MSNEIETLFEEEYIPGGYPQRTMCNVLEEMRRYLKIYINEQGATHMLGLVEEVQTIANRMEADLHNRKDYYKLMKMLRKKVKKLRHL